MARRHPRLERRGHYPYRRDGTHYTIAQRGTADNDVVCGYSTFEPSIAACLRPPRNTLRRDRKPVQAFGRIAANMRTQELHQCGIFGHKASNGTSREPRLALHTRLSTQIELNRRQRHYSIVQILTLYQHQPRYDK